MFWGGQKTWQVTRGVKTPLIYARLSVLCSLASEINDMSCFPFSEHCELGSWMVNSASINIESSYLPINPISETNSHDVEITMPAKKLSLRPAKTALAKVRKELVKRKKGATATQAAALNKQIKHIDQANQSLIVACHRAYNVG
jgi:hypothetical protein